MSRYCMLCRLPQLKLDENRSFHKFPSSEVMKRKWLLALEISEVSKFAVICSDHFTTDDFFNVTGNAVVRRRIKTTAVPSQNLRIQGSLVAVSAPCSWSIPNESSASSSNEASCSRMEVDDFCGDDTIATSSVNALMINNDIFSPGAGAGVVNFRKDDVNEHSFRSFSQPKSLVNRIKLVVNHRTEWFSAEDFHSDSKWQHFRNYVLSSRKEHRTIHQKMKRWKDRIATSKDLLANLKEKNFLSDAGEDSISKSLEPGVQSLIESVLKGKRFPSYPEALKKFAMTLHFYSPKGYDYLRSSVNKLLPHPSMLREWLRTVNYEPGISREAFQTVEDFAKNALAQGKKLYFNLCLDDMSIRKHVSWNKSTHKFEGLIDLGRPTEGQDNEEQASNALVFMLVCINGYFKIPVAYYLINALNGDRKSSLVLEILDECYVHEVDVRNLTFDGASSNISTVEKLGASIYGNTSTAYFESEISGKPVYISLDACHMIKLVRNALLSHSIVDGDGLTISWDYMKKLVKVKEEEGLHLAKKMRRQHVAPLNQKMKVGLAAQVLSSSVAAALETCEFELELAEFQGASATARFCRVIDDCFNLLNSRNRFNKCPSKSAIDPENLEGLKIKVDSYTSYIENLKIDGQSILKTNKRTGFLGLIISIKNALQMAADMFAEGLEFLLTYKISQDHLEMFFACIRTAGGFNNNPTAVQFKSAYRKLISHVNIKVPLTANCTPKDDTLILMTGARTDENSNEKENEANGIFEASMLGELNMYTDEVNAYVSEAIVKSVRKKITCPDCIENLTLEKGRNSLSSLQVKKTYGALTSASEDVILVCRTAEKVLKAQSSLVQPKVIDKMIITALNLLPINELFARNEHVYEQAPLFDHRNQLIRIVLRQYFSLRLHNEAAKLSEFKARTGTKLQRIIVFSNQ